MATSFDKRYLADDGVQFGLEGPMMQGTWINPSTGHKFTVLDSFFQDGQFMVQTTDGQLLDYNTIQNYVQCVNQNGKEVPVDRSVFPSSSPAVQKPGRLPDLPAAVATEIDTTYAPGPEEDNQMIPEDKALTMDPFSAGLPSRSNIYKENPPAIDPDILMIQKVLNNFPGPKLNISFTWKPAPPSTQLDTLVRTLMVDPSKIVDYYISQLQVENLIPEIQSSLESFLDIQMKSFSSPMEEPKKEEPKKAAAKKRPTGTSKNKNTTHDHD